MLSSTVCQQNEWDVVLLQVLQRLYRARDGLRDMQQDTIDAESFALACFVRYETM